MTLSVGHHWTIVGNAGTKKEKHTSNEVKVQIALVISLQIVCINSCFQIGLHREVAGPQS